MARLAEDIERASKSANFDLQIVSAEIDPAKQANDVNTLVSSGVTGLIIDAVNADAIGGTIDRAAAAGVKVVVVDSAAVANKTIAMQVLPDNITAGGRASVQDHRRHAAR